jgi:hypothetical protein
VAIPYGVAAVGADDVLAGSNVPTPPSGQPIWRRQVACTMYMTLTNNEETGTAPLSVNVTASPHESHGNVQTDWWFGDGSYAPGNSSQTFTYNNPGNYTLLVRGLDSVGCLSEARGAFSVMHPAVTGSYPPSTSSMSRTSFFLIVAVLAVVAPIMVLRRKPQLPTKRMLNT